MGMAKLRVVGTSMGMASRAKTIFGATLDAALRLMALGFNFALLGFILVGCRAIFDSKLAPRRSNRG